MKKISKFLHNIWEEYLDKVSEWLRVLIYCTAWIGMIWGGPVVRWIVALPCLLSLFELFAWTCFILLVLGSQVMIEDDY